MSEANDGIGIFRASLYYILDELHDSEISTDFYSFEPVRDDVKRRLRTVKEAISDRKSEG